MGDSEIDGGRTSARRRPPGRKEADLLSPLRTAPPRPLLVALTVSIVLGLGSSGAARASTTVSGGTDPHVPLEIRPDTDPRVSELDLGGGDVDPAFIQRMPATKTVTKVTLGDFARADGCRADARVRLYVREHPTGDLRASEEVARSRTVAAIGVASGRVSWEIPATTFAAGRGYSFRLAWEAFDCRYLKQTTWAHNLGQVNAGPERCGYDEPPVGATRGGRRWQRMWHAPGADDSVAGCVVKHWSSRPPFEPSMPPGWLATHTYNGDDWYVAVHTHHPDAPPHELCGDDPRYRGSGVEEVYWRPTPDSTDGATDHVCRWTQYPAAPGATVPDGWYYGLPWLRERNGAPSDVYLRLDDTTPPTDAALLARYRPLLRYDAQETYRADAADTITDNRGARRRGGNFLKRGHRVLAAAAPQRRQPALTLAYLGHPLYSDRAPARDVDYLDEGRDYAADAQRMHGEARYANRVYGRIRRYPSGEAVLQYWLFYYYNPKSYAKRGVHEGDWEMVQVHLGADARPVGATYAQHGGGERCDWAHVQRVSGDRPVVYVAEGSHASYFSSGFHLNGLAFDTANGDGEILVPALIDITRPPTWVSWPGRWGSTVGRLPREPNSPGGPGHGDNRAKWEDPLGWSRSVGGCTESQIQASAAGSGRLRRAVTRAAVRMAPRLPRVRARRRGSRVLIDYRFAALPTGARRPWQLLVSVKGGAKGIPPLTTRRGIRRRIGRVEQRLGRGRGPFRLLVSVRAASGARSRTIALPLK